MNGRVYMVRVSLLSPISYGSGAVSCVEWHRASGDPLTGFADSRAVVAGWVSDILDAYDLGELLSWSVELIAGTVADVEDWETAADVTIALGMMTDRVVVESVRGRGLRGVA